jgi:hypothetical protein
MEADPMTACGHRHDGEALTDAGRRTFMLNTAAVAAAGLAAPAEAALDADKRKFIQEATQLAIESVQKGWGAHSAPSSSRTARSSDADRTVC